jgi:hypothetical protein
MIVMIYLLGWLLTSVVSARLLKRRVSSAPHPWAVSVFAGGAWLVLLVGAAQFGALLAIRKALAEEDDEYDVIPTAAEEFV